jgi:HAD superfamily hydrolase (TIGR01509 family)
MSIEIYKAGDTPVIRGVLFDMDGLVLDTEKLYSRFWMEACHFYGYPMTYEQSLEMRAANSRLGAENLHRFFGPDIDYVTIRNKRIELMDAFIAENGVEPKPGIFELLDALEARGIPAAITSSSPADRIRDHLESLGVYHRFTAICSGYDVPCGKPAPDIYLHGAASLGLPPEECLALEDAPLGILSAFRANCIPVMVPDQAQPDAQTQSMLYAQADTLSDIISLLK